MRGAVSNHRPYRDRPAGWTPQWRANMIVYPWSDDTTWPKSASNAAVRAGLVSQSALLASDFVAEHLIEHAVDSARIFAFPQFVGGSRYLRCRRQRR